MSVATHGAPVAGRNTPLIFLAVLTVFTLLVVAAGNGSRGDLEAEPDSVLPIPKQNTTSTTTTIVMRVADTKETIRYNLVADVAAGLRNVLGFYRNELDKRGWKEIDEGAILQPDRVQLAFTSPDGPGLLKLGTANGRTTIELGQKLSAAAARSGMVPEPGHAKLISEGLDGVDVSVSIDGQTIKVARDSGERKSSTFTIDLPPGKFPYSLEFAEGPQRGRPIEIATGDTWGITKTLSGELMAQHLY